VLRGIIQNFDISHISALGSAVFVPNIGHSKSTGATVSWLVHSLADRPIW